MKVATLVSTVKECELLEAEEVVRPAFAKLRSGRAVLGLWGVGVEVRRCAVLELFCVAQALAKGLHFLEKVWD